MAVERKFITEGVRKVRVEKYLTKELKRAGFGGMDIDDKNQILVGKGSQVAVFAVNPK